MHHTHEKATAIAAPAAQARNHPADCAGAVTQAVSAGVLLNWHSSAEGPWAEVLLQHEGKLNAMSVAMWQQLRAVFLSIQDSQARCVLIKGTGGAFCAGGDISEYQSFRFKEESLQHFHETLVWGGLQAMLDCDVPIIAQIEGACMGAGVEIACCCDIRLASDNALFGAPIAKLGFPMAPRELQLVQRTAGDALVRRMLLGAEVIGSGAMVASGFLAEIAAQAQLEALVMKRLERLLPLAPQAARMHKQALRVLLQDGSAGLAALLPSAYRYAESAEHREGISAFLEKRKPQFK
ncbi:enoyl-CoA hydratase/isomerase family protein [Lampropedia puyangensis]|uniref:Enoyl-CoA hydratase/isomerase family protein n=1 Tax=Lampropedia puyangensis TaxID=1330072 RepID=A0A4S8FCA8_9BURK|nr:enoyl-CoA hydratase/isomerase family protein [Lampropedia puyangensis]THU05253.1 enoyl-CoA hydratase/isomerase family protein [Lampropedia puyangensis]